MNLPKRNTVRRRTAKALISTLGALAVCVGVFGVSAVAQALTVELRASESKDAAVSSQVKLYASSHALVIGNDLYTGAWPRLSNAVKDARLVAQALHAKGFKVTLKTNLKATELVDALETFFYETGQDPEARLFLWYAGHGYSERGEGYLVPIDAPDASETGLFLRKALSLRRMGEYVRGASALHILSVFDSCFAGTVFNVGRAKPPAGITYATTRPVRQFLTSGDAGQEVSDDGTFRKLFIRALNGEVRADANRDGYLAASELGLYMTSEITNYSNGGQTPRNGKLNDPDLDQGDFIFQIAARQPEPKRQSAPKPVKPTVDRSAELLFWESVKDSKSTADFEDYLAAFPNGTFKGIAKRRIASLKNPPKKRNLPVAPGAEADVAFWNSIQKSRNAADFRDYLARFPRGIFRDLAQRRIKDLQKKPTREELIASIATSFIGTYQGRITLKNGTGPVTTKLFIDGQGRFSGKYTYNNRSHGTLTNARRTGPFAFAFTWHEPVGRGELVIRFAPNYRSFEGYWTWAGNSGRLSWTGARQ